MMRSYVRIVILLSISSLLFTTNHLAQSSIDFDSLVTNLSKWVKSEEFPALEDSIHYWISLSKEEGVDCEHYCNLSYKLGYYYLRQKDYVASIDQYKNHALEGWKKCDGCASFDCVKTMYNIGNNYRKLQSYPSADKYFKESMLLAESLSDTDTLVYIRMLKSIGEFYYNAGDHGKSNFYYSKINTLYASLGLENSLAYAKVLNNWGTNLNEQGSFIECRSKFDQAYKIYSSYPSNEVERKLAVLFYHMSHNCIDIGEYEKASAYLDKAQKYNFPNDEYLQDTRAHILKKEGKYAEALTIQKESLKESIINGKPLDISGAYENIADLYFLNNQIDSSLLCYDLAIKKILRNDLNEELTLEKIKKNSTVHEIYLIRQLFFKSVALMKAEKINDNFSENSVAIQYFEYADQLISERLNSLALHDSKYILINKIIKHYARAIEHALEIAEKTQHSSILNDAHRYASRYKALLLTESKLAQKAEYNYLTEVEKKELNILQQNYYSIKSKYDLHQVNEPLLSNSIVDSMFLIQENYTQYLKKIEQGNPAYKNAKRAKSHLSVEEIQSELPGQTALLEYFYSDSILFSFLITQSRVEVHPIHLTPYLNEQISKLKLTLEGNENIDVDQEAIAEALLPNLQFMQNDDIDKLVVIPDGPLWHIPFEALRMEDQFMIENFIISYRYSSQLMHTSPILRTHNSERFLAIGTSYSDEGMAAVNDYILEHTLDKKGVTLHSLVNIESEFDSLRAVWDTDTFLQEEATLDHFQREANHYDIIHLSLHGVYLDAAEEAILFFDPSKDEEFAMTSELLYAMNLDADLVVLSACQTGVGKLNMGEGMVSLARNFAHAGVSSLVASKWNTTEDVSSRILVDFYKEIKRGAPKDVALHNAKLKFIREAPPSQSSPYFWANLVLIGETGSLVKISGESSNYTLMFLLLCFFGFLFFKWKGMLS